MLCNIKPVPFHESDKHIFAKIPGGPDPRSPPLDPPMCTLLWLRFLFSTLLKLLRMFALVISWMSLKIGHVGSKSRSLGQILEKPVYAVEATFSVQYS